MQRNILVETDQEVTDKKQASKGISIRNINNTKCVFKKLEEIMNGMRGTMEDTKIYIGLLQMKITVYGINNI